MSENLVKATSAVHPQHCPRSEYETMLLEKTEALAKALDVASAAEIVAAREAQTAEETAAQLLAAAYRDGQIDGKNEAQRKAQETAVLNSDANLQTYRERALDAQENKTRWQNELRIAEVWHRTAVELVRLEAARWGALKGA